MELLVLVRELKRIIDEADVALDADNVEESREHLREAKALLDDEFLND